MTKPESFIVRVLGPEGEGSVGAGALVGSRHIVTCAHVVNAALGRESQREQDKPEGLQVSIAFPLLDGGAAETVLTASLDVWRPPPPKPGAAGDDVAGLIIEGDLPEGASPAQLATDPPRLDSAVRVCGFPPGRPPGNWVPTTVEGMVANRRLQLSSKPGSTLRVMPGFSGGPVIDNDSGQVIGIVAESGLDPESGKEADDSYAISANVLLKAWPKIPRPRHWRRILLAGSIAAIAAAAVLLSYPHIGTTGVSAKGGSTIAVGEYPDAVAVDPAAHVAFVANAGGDSVSVINTRTNTVAATVSVDGWPDGVAIDPAAHAAYVTNEKDSTVSVIDTVNNAITGTIPVGKGTSSVAVDPADRTAYVTNAGSDSVSAISTVTNLVTKTIAVGKQPDAVAVDPAAHVAFVANAGGDSVSVINTVTNVAATIRVGMRPYALGVDPATHTAYITADDGNSILAMNTVTAVTKAIPVGTFPYSVAVDPAAHVAFVANAGGDSVSVINTRTNTVAATVHVRNSPHAVAVDPTSHTAYVANYGDGSVSIIKAP